MPAIYLDVCCLNRPFDDGAQARIRLEAEAVVLVIARVGAGTDEWIASDVVTYEVRQTPDPDRRARVNLLTTAASRVVRLGEAEERRAEELAAVGFPPMDALHLACAEVGGAEVLLTTDDRLSRAARREAGRLRIRVENPVIWLAEQERTIP